MEDWKPGGAGAGFPLAAFLHSFKCHFEPVECFDEIKFKSPFLLWAVVAQILHHILLCILDSSIPTNRAQTVGHCCIKHITSVKWDRRFVLPRGAFNAEHSHFWVSSLADLGLKGFLGENHSHVPATSVAALGTLLQDKSAVRSEHPEMSHASEGFP